ncbi:MAG: hypothetical protein GY856_53370 [bacterium]|nr:hypothetical protein [bacterium]
MSIQKFHSMIRPGNENGALFMAFRKLNNLKDPVNTLSEKLRELRSWGQWYVESPELV